ncbi:MAG: DUF4157 domain-containing protein [Proteobacteria bacterium]|nr:DUF4157 domain-containing protein [Pseudomonadota bacterium]MBU4295123.1 DUF4157 domain-containing protein [Pseudomonadota bacterium]MCG2746987.1 DUF4157 domain-containing protein [Desulfobulbaceae bacterium]
MDSTKQYKLKTRVAKTKVSTRIERRPLKSTESGAEAGLPLYLMANHYVAAVSSPSGEMQIQRQIEESSEVEQQQEVSSPAVQSNLIVAKEDDPLEKEADHVAESICGYCGTGLANDNAIQKKDVTENSAAAVSKTTARVNQSIHSPGPGAPLSASMRKRIELAVNANLSAVRVHDDSNAQAAAEDLHAKAFTHGKHIFLAQRHSADDTKLMAHEATHVIQQGAASDVVQRTPDYEDTVCEPEDDFQNEPGNDFSNDPGRQSDIPTPPPTQRQREAETGGILSQLPERTEQEQGDLNTILEAYELYRTIEQKEAMERRFRHEERRGMGIVRYTTHNQQVMQRIQNEIDGEVQRLGLDSEQAAKTLIRRRMPSMVLRRAKQAAISLLNENERLARAEMARYADLVCSPDIDGLLDADRELGARYAAMQSTEYDVNRASMYISAVPAGVPETAADYGIPANEESIMYVITRIDEYRERLQNQKQEYEEMRSRFGQVYPVLMAEGYEPGRFSSAPAEQLAQLTAKPLQEIIDNIYKVKEAVREDEMKVWNMHQVLEIAIADMHIGGIPEYMEIVRQRIEQEQKDASFIELVKAALAITTTIIAGLVGGPLAASLVGGAWGTYFLTESAGRYFTESAAENVAMDPAVRDISINEPELIWVVIDVVGLGLDVGAFVRAIRPIARAALQTRRIAEFSQAVRRLAPEAADRLISSLRRRLGREVMDEGVGGAAAVRAMGEGRNLDEYLQALRSEQHSAGTVGRSWDYQNQPLGVSDAQWRPGYPIDTPNTRGTYPAYGKARSRYWRNRAHFELDARARGEAVRRPGVTTDPVSGLSDEELRLMRDNGRAPQYAYGTRAGQTWELEHHGVPQRVGGWLRDLGFDQPGEASRLIEASRPGALMESTPLEHAFWDVEAHGFGSLRADVTGARWAGTAAADVRGTRPLYYMSDDTIRSIVNRAAGEGMDFSRTGGTQQLRAALVQEITARRLSVSLP